MRVTIFAALMVLVGCGADPVLMSSTDAGQVPDAAFFGDAADMGNDAGEQPDAGSDAGFVVVIPDATVTMPDSGAAGRDSGSPDSGSIGTDSGPPDAGPPPADRTRVAQLALGTGHSCLLRTSGRVHCWGNPLSSSVPTAQPLSLGAVEVSAGADQTCAATADGSVSCWSTSVPADTGVVSVDALSVSCASSAGSVSCWRPGATTPVFSDVTDLDAFDVHGGCAVRASTTVSCWTNPGRSGTATPPVRPVGAISQISVGSSHGCVIGDSGSVWCWGDNGRGQVGSFDYRSGLPLTMAGRGISDTATPAYAEVAAGRAHTCGRRTDGSVWCWGDNSFGQLGHTTGELTRDHRAAEVLIGSSRMNAISIDVGADHSCAALTDGRVFCWGSNSVGQLGRWVDGLMTVDPVEPDGFWLD